MLLTFPVMGIKLNSVDQTVEWQFDRVILLGVAIFFLSMLWNWCFSRKARGIPLIRLPEGLGKGLHSLVTLPNRNTTTRLTSLGLLLAVMIVMPLVSSFYQTNIMISAMLYVILALGLNIAVGIAGQLVLGYVAFYAVGAYSYALLNQAFGLGFWACLPVGGFMAIVFGLALGFPVLRLRGDYLAIVTLGFGLIVENVIANLPFAGGEGLANGTASSSLYANGLGLSTSLQAKYVWLVLGITILCIALMCMFIRSKYGRAIEAIRDDEIAASASGVNTTYYKILTFVISAFFAGLSGGLYAGGGHESVPLRLCHRSPAYVRLSAGADPPLSGAAVRAASGPHRPAYQCARRPLRGAAGRGLACDVGPDARTSACCAGRTASALCGGSLLPDECRSVRQPP